MRRARRGGREVSFAISVRKKGKKEEGKFTGHVSDIPESHLAPPPCSAAVRHRDTGSPRGSPLRSRSAGASATPYTSRRSHLGACLGPRAGARAEASSCPACPVGRRSLGRVSDKTRRPDREFANVRGRASPRADASAERPDSAAKRARRRPLLDLLSRRETPPARVVVARASVLTMLRWGIWKTRPLREESSNQRAENLRAKFTLWSMGFQIEPRRGNRTRVNS